MPRSKKPELHFPIKLTLAQRKLVAAVVPAFADRLKLDEPNQRIIDFTEAELKKLKAAAETAIQKSSTGYERRPLRLVLKATDQDISHCTSCRSPTPCTNSRSPCWKAFPRSGGESRCRTARSTSCMSTSRRRWAG